MEISDSHIKWAFTDPCPWCDSRHLEHIGPEMSGCLYMLLFTTEGRSLFQEKNTNNNLEH